MGRILSNGPIISLLDKKSKDAHILAFKLKQISELFSINPSLKLPEVAYPLIHMAGVTAKNICEISKMGAMYSRDLYGSARSCVELCINFTYLFSGNPSIPKDMHDHANFMLISRMKREHEIGGIKFDVFRDLEMNDLELRYFSSISNRFTTKKGRKRSWSDLSAPQKLEEISKKFGPKISTMLIASYVIIYEISSEYLHGSLYSAYHFYGMGEGMPAIIYLT